MTRGQEPGCVRRGRGLWKTTSVLFGESTFVTWRAQMKWARVNSGGLLNIRIREYLWHCDFVVVERIWHKSICVCVCLLVYLLASYFIEVNQMNAIVDQHNNTMPVSLPELPKMTLKLRFIGDANKSVRCSASTGTAGWCSLNLF